MTTPRIFISYSHDTQAHKDWVETLAIRLRRSGVDATLDQWDASPGDDLTLFMERGVTESDRVIVICTANYVAKADAGIGGVGYERMIVTAELVRNIGTNKFIPILRSPLPEQRTPKFLSTRKFVDFSDEQHEDESFEELLRELHKVPPKRKPAIGANPYALSPLGQETSQEAAVNLVPQETQREKLNVVAFPTSGAEQHPPTTALDAYLVSRELAVASDTLRWQRISKQVSANCGVDLLQWRKRRENEGMSSPQAKVLLDEAVMCLAPLFCFSLAAVESGRQAFRDQSGLLFDILDIRGWAKAGGTWFVNLPASFVFIFHHLHGALCAYTGQFNVALILAERKIQTVGVSEFRRVCQSHELLGWPEALDGNSLTGWEYLLSAPSRWDWLVGIFDKGGSYAESLIAYRMLLNIHELVLLLATGASVDSLKAEDTSLDVPLNFAIEDRTLNQRAFQLLLQRPEQIAAIWETRNINLETIKAAWPKWMDVCKYWVGRSNRAMFRTGALAHAPLFDAL